MYKKISHSILLIIFFFFSFCLPVFAQGSIQENFTLWNHQCVDTMKSSRDRAREWVHRKDLSQIIEKELEAIHELGANCVAVGTPYDEEFIPYLKIWVDAIHKKGFMVWFRGNFSSWEGWLEYPKMTSASWHIQKTENFIKKHPDLFRDGDIFTPAPEPENGGPGDPRSTGRKKEFLQFLKDSYKSCNQALVGIGKKVKCGYFSTNGDVAEQILDKETVKEIGNMVVIDHYVDSIERFEKDILHLSQKYEAPVILGEFGDSHAEFVNKLLQVLYKNRNTVHGINYWVLNGGETALLHDDNSKKEVFDIVKKYYRPARLAGIVQNTLQIPLTEVIIKSVEYNVSVYTNDKGRFELDMPSGNITIIIEKSGYKTKQMKFDFKENEIKSIDFELEPIHKSFIYNLKLYLQKLGRNIFNLR